MIGEEGPENEGLRKRIVALVPAKPLDQSKTRLSPALSPGERRDLVLRLLERVLKAAQEADSIDVCWVVGGDDPIESLAMRFGVRWFPELGDGLNSTLAKALNRLPANVAQALILPMDLPFLTGEVVDALVGRLVAKGVDVVIAPDRWRRGTNALLLTRPFTLPPSFGRDSFTRHQDAAELHGFHVALHFAPEIAFDLDTPIDLAESGLLIQEEERSSATPGKGEGAFDV